MSPRTGDNDPSPSKKYPLRLQMPVDDPDVDAFLAAQGVRFQSQAIVMLIRMWVNEFGPTNVLEQTMGAVTVSALKQHPSTNRTSARPATAQSPPGPQQYDRSATTDEPEPATAEDPESAPRSAPQATPPPAPPAPSTPAGPSDDFEDLFRKKKS